MPEAPRGNTRHRGISLDFTFGAVAAFGGIEGSWLARLASLFVLPFAHEDVAIVTGAFFIVNELMPTGLVAASIYGGMVMSDFALYGLGVAARRLPWLDRYAVDDKVRRFSEIVKRNLFAVVTLCRVVPGVVFVAFIACGWSRVSLPRFALASLIVSALYLPLVLYLAIAFGDQLHERIGLWAWPLLLGALAATGLLRKRIFAFAAANTAAALDAQADEAGAAAQPLPEHGQLAAAERIPPLLFYAPLALSWIGLGLRHRSLSLPSAANPRIVTGGMWGESKSGYLAGLEPHERRWFADFAVLTRSQDATAASDTGDALARIAAAGLRFPLIAKPDIGWQGYGVRRIEDARMLHDYVAAFPAGGDIMLQRLVDWPGEAGVLYARAPGAVRGRVVSLTLRYAPRVVGDGASSVRELIARDPRARWKRALHLGRDPHHNGLSAGELDRVAARGETVQLSFLGSQRAGALYRDATPRVTAALHARFEAIAASLTELHYGRFDLRFQSIEALLRGEDFLIVEVNGIGGESIDVWDPAASVTEAYRRLFAQQRLVFAIGAHNRARGFRPSGTVGFLTPLLRQTALIGRYPRSG